MMPWDYHPHLTEKRLKAVASFLKSARDDALDRFEPDIGDGQWSLQCRAHELQKNRIIRASLRPENNWLRIEDGSLRLQFRIGDVLFRFYRGDRNTPKKKSLRRTFDELRQGSFVFEDGSTSTNLKWNFVVETDVDGDVTDIIVVGCHDEQHIVCQWVVPLDDDVRMISVVDSHVDNGVELPPPGVGDILPATDEKEYEDNAGT